MLRQLSDWVYRISGLWSLLAITLLYGYFIATVMPHQSVESSGYAGDWGAPDRHVLFTPDEFYTNIATWGDDGRSKYIAFRFSLDIVWAIAYTGWLAIFISILLRYLYPPTDRRRWLNLPVLLPGLMDLAENFLCILLVANHDTRMDALVWLTTSVTALKWITLVLANLGLLVLLAIVAVRRINHRAA